jgi:hypothetical protein
MGTREILNNRKSLVTVVCGLITVVALGSIIARNVGGSEEAIANERAYFTSDDGETYWAENTDRVPPFTHESKVAVRAMVYQCGGNKFVAYLMRYTADGKQAVEQTIAQRSAPKPDGSIQRTASAVARSGVELKRPGEANWVIGTSIEGSKIRAVQCPHDQKHVPEMVYPD